MLKTAPTSLLAARRGAILAVVVLLLGGCSASGPLPSGARPATPLPGGVAVALEGLQHVNVDLDATRAAAIGPEGGSISALGRDGTAYTLSLPAGALAAETTVSVSPVTSLTTLPDGTKLSAGVQFGPDGLRLLAPGTLVIRSPQGAAPAHGFISWDGDGEHLHTPAATVVGGITTLAVLHFSGLGLTPEQVAAVTNCLVGDFACETDDFMDDFYVAAGHHDRDGMIGAMDLLYHEVAVKAFSHSLDFELPGPSVHPPDEAADAYPYDMFWSVMTLERDIDPTFTIGPDLAASRSLATDFLQSWYTVENRECRDDADDPRVATPISWAVAALDGARAHAGLWQLDTRANHLDAASLLDNLCVKVVIDPSRSYSGTRPDFGGTLSIKAGFTIADGPFRVSPNPIRVVAHFTGNPDALIDRDTDASGIVTLDDLIWPHAVDPLRIDILATLTLDQGGQELLSSIARFDRITKRSGASVSVPPASGSIEVVVSSVAGLCRVFGVGTIDKATDESIDATVTASGAASLFDSPGGGNTRFTATGSGVVTFTATANGKSGQASTYIDALAGDFETGGQQMAVNARIGSDGQISYDVNFLTSPNGGAWTGVIAEDGRLKATDPAGRTLDVTITPTHLVGTIDGTAVDLARVCGTL